MEVLQRTANRGSIATGAAYEIENSLKLNSANSEYLYQTRDTSGSDWNRLKWTASLWVKHIPTPDSNVNPKERMFGAADANSDFDIRFRGEPLGFRNNSDVDGAAELRTTALYRDYSAWYHVVAVWDTANATAGDRMKLYVNGEEVTDFSVDTQPSLNAKSIWGKKNDGTDGNVTHTIGAFYNYYSGFSQGFNGYMAEIYWVEGQALTPTDFGVYDNDSGIWKPKAYTGSYGTNGFYLDFSNASNLGADASGNGNDWTLNNITSADQATDTPTNNFCTLNILDQEFDGTNIITDGATNVRIAGSGSGALRGTYAVSQGKWYWEMKITPINTSSFYGVWGIYTADKNLTGYPGSTTGSWGIYGGNGKAYYNGSSTTFYTDSIASGDIFSYAFNADDGQLFLYKNGSIIGANSGDLIATSGTSFPADFTYYSPTFADGTNSPEPSGLLSRFEVNFGGFTNFSIASGNTDENGYGNFEYAPPSGYYALCSKNLAEFG